ncbi:MAG: ATP-grasp domain-containing protein, partial [Anaerolineales bacterium]
IPGWAPGDADIQYPVMVKAAGGGGGKGMRRVHAASELPEAIGAAQREAASSFGDERVYLEKYIRAARHVEFQILGDAQGNVIHLYERECSIQRRHQKIVEETPSPYLDAALRERMAAAAVTAARAVNYIGAGTVEFIVDAETRDYYFLEMNTRLQVEHPITEMTTGIDLVQAQLRIANGEPLWLQQPDVVQRGHALECRLYAEDPAHDFLPAAGRVLAMEMPRGPGVRVDTGIEHGDAVSVHYDPLIAKLIVHAKDRPAALRRMAAALRATAVLGVPTNVAFLQDVVAHPTFVDGAYTTAFVEEQLPGWLPTPAEISPAFALVAALAELTRTPARSAHDAGRATPWDRADGFRMGV